MTVYRVIESCPFSPEQGDPVAEFWTRPEAEAYISKNEEASLEGGFGLFIIPVSDK